MSSDNPSGNKRIRPVIPYVVGKQSVGNKRIRSVIPYVVGKQSVGNKRIRSVILYVVGKQSVGNKRRVPQVSLLRPGILLVEAS
jgi:hypothetical protein